jgi:RNA polymerase sigma-54 factor
MRLDFSQNLRLEQRMKLAPRIIQAMEILQLPVMALQERIAAELASNPVLDLDEPGVDAESPPERVDEPDPRGEHDMVVNAGNGNSEDFQRLAEFEEEFGSDFARSDAPARPKGDSGERDRKMDAMANTPAPAASLTDYLMDQWRFVETTDDVRRAGELVISFIDADGYFRASLDDLQLQSPQPIRAEVLEKTLALVQTLEPTGVGARNLKECLLIQLEVEAQAGKDVTLETELVRHHLHDIELNRLPQISRRTGKSIERIKTAIENLSHLNPRPGSLIGGQDVPVITPDVVVDLDEDGNVVVTTPDGHMPQLHISRSYQRMARDRSTDRKARKFIRDNIRSAQWVIGAIEQRQQTILRVAEEVFKAQRAFLDSGVEALKPLPMADIANKVGVHVATVSRAVSGKYAQTPRGIVPLRMFFSGGTRTEEGQDVSWDAVKAKLREIIDGEDKSEPLNDDELADAVKAQGIDIARRTVAKYRNLMEIPPARQRKEY